MGLFKQLRDAKDAVAAAPGLVDQAQRMAAAAQEFQAGAMAEQQAVMDQAVAHQMAATGELGVRPGGLEPIDRQQLFAGARDAADPLDAR